jgi:uncharacterized protein (TIGR00251 family)
MRINIVVKTNAKKNEILGYDKKLNAYKVNVKAAPENNKANLEIIKLFSKQYKTSAKIVKGLKSKKKVIEI